MRMPSVLIQTQILLFCVRLVLQGQTPAAQNPATSSRMVRIGGTRGKPAYTFHISAKGSQGVIEVRDASDFDVQTLTCPMLRDVTNPSKAELDGVGESFVGLFGVEDLNFDGYLDIKAVREHGAKWGIYCVWLFDPQQRLFVKDRVAQEMEMLPNLEADPRGAASSPAISVPRTPCATSTGLRPLTRAGRTGVASSLSKPASSRRGSNHRTGRLF